MNTNRLSLALSSVALVIATAGVGGPAIARAIVPNADKVDGKHAVGSGATVAARKGKLVATSPTTGRLPNNIIAKALDADKLDGIDSGTFATDAEVNDLRSELSTAGTVNLPGNPVDWTKLKGVPGALTNGDALEGSFSGVQVNDAVLAAGANITWTTHSWSPNLTVIWEAMPEVASANLQLKSTQWRTRQDNGLVTHYIFVENVSGSSITYDLRYHALTR